MFSLSGKPLRLSSRSIVSSTMPGIVENSCSTPSIFTYVTAAPGIEREQHAAQRVAERDAEAALERLDHELGVVFAPLANFDLARLAAYPGRSLWCRVSFVAAYVIRRAPSGAPTIGRLAAAWW